MEADILGKSEAGPKLQGLPEGGEEDLRGPSKQSQLILKKQGRRRGRCHTKSSRLGGSPVQSTGIEMSRARLQILRSGKSICGKKGHEKGMVPSDGQRTTPPKSLRNTPPWWYTGLCKRFSYSFGAPF